MKLLSIKNIHPKNANRHKYKIIPTGINSHNNCSMVERLQIYPIVSKKFPCDNAKITFTLALTWTKAVIVSTHSFMTIATTASASVTY